MADSRICASFLLLSAMASAGAMAERPVQIVSEGKGGNLWSPEAPLLEPDYPPGLDGASGDVCVSIGYYVGADGTASQFANLKSWSASAPAAGEANHRLDIFQQTAVAALLRRHFIPAKASEPQPMYTSATFVFAADPGSDKARLRSRCAIRDLKGFIAKAQTSADPLTWNQIRWNSEWFHAKNTRIHGLNRE